MLFSGSVVGAVLQDALPQLGACIKVVGLEQPGWQHFCNCKLEPGASAYLEASIASDGTGQISEYMTRGHAAVVLGCLAGCIAAAWRLYQGSGARAARLAALVRLQAGARGMAARKSARVLREQARIRQQMQLAAAQGI